MIIRLINQSDNKKLAELIRNVFDEHDAPRVGTVYSDPTTDNLYQLFQMPKSLLWVAEIDHQVMGCCGVFPTEGLPDKCAELVKFYIHPDSRGKGVGKALMQKSIDAAKDLGYKQIYLESLLEFSNAVSMYEKQGFKKLSYPLGNSGHTTCNIWMVKDL